MKRGSPSKVSRQEAIEQSSPRRLLCLNEEQLDEKTRFYDKDPDIEYDKPILAIVDESQDSYSIQLLCEMIRSISELSKLLTKNPDLHPDIIESGIAWKTLKNVYFHLKEEVTIFKDLKIGIRLSVVAMKNMISFTYLAFYQS